jgi:pSer/pThr/pTyr-binding forkhead associated (FHA) protein
MATVSVYLGDRCLQAVPITRVETVVGRDVLCDVRIDNPAISRRHAKITFLDGTFYIEDIGSSNGIFLDGKKIARDRLYEGASAKFGKFSLDFTQSGGAPLSQLRGTSLAGAVATPLNTDQTTILKAADLDRLHVAKVKEIAKIEPLPMPAMQPARSRVPYAWIAAAFLLGAVLVLLLR